MRHATLLLVDAAPTRDMTPLRWVRHRMETLFAEAEADCRRKMLDARI
jgi:hypothetical protein